MRMPHVEYLNFREKSFLNPFFSYLMVTHKYEYVETLPEHTSSITVLLFSPDGEYLASGCESGVVLVTATDPWKTVKKLVNVSPVTAILWDPTFPMTIVCGFASGAIVTVHIGDSDTVRRFFIKVVLEC